MKRPAFVFQIQFLKKYGSLNDGLSIDLLSSKCQMVSSFHILVIDFISSLILQSDPALKYPRASTCCCFTKTYTE